MSQENHHEVSTEVAIKKNERWEDQNSAMEGLVVDGAAMTLDTENKPEAKEAILEGKESLCCIDEGTGHMEMNGKLTLAGSGILYPPKNNWQERLEKVADRCLMLGIREVTSHDGCGAAAKAFERDGGKAVLGEMTADEYGQKWAKELQALMNKKLNQAEAVSYRNISATGPDGMVRPAEFHDARTIWFDATGNFNPDKLGNKVPHGFLINDGNEVKLAEDEAEKNYPFEELELAIDIAFNHGFNEKFTPAEPLVVVVLATSAEELEEIKSEVAKYLPATDVDRIKVDGAVLAI
ncbi:MAG: hypothetical protein WCT37_05235 [Patescibacteria group bacterium]